MNKFKKLKQSTKFSYNEDSSDYISDVEGSTNKGRIDIDSINEGNSNSHFLGVADDYSNDSFSNTDRDAAGESSSTTSKPKSSTGVSKLSECLDYLHRMIVRKDKEGIFEYPVTDLIAPGYSMIIKHPMDLGTMKTKIESGEYTNIMEYRDDVILMCENCMTYNRQDTIYYQFAKKMLDYGFKLLSRERLLNFRSTVRCMRYLTSEELGFSFDSSELYYDTNAIRKKQSENKLAAFKIDPLSLIHSNLDLSETEIVKESWIIPPEGEEDPEDETDEEKAKREEEAREMTAKVQELAQAAASKLATKNPNGKMGFLRRNSNGTTGYHIIEKRDFTLKADDSTMDDNVENNEATEESEIDSIKVEVDSELKKEIIEPKSEPKADTESREQVKNTEKDVTIGNLMMGLQASSYSMANYFEEKKDKTKPMHFIESGPFSSEAPTEDTTFKNIPKEDLNILSLAYGDEFGYQYALSLMEFSKGSTEDFQKYVKTLLNELSCNEHEKYLKHLANKSAPGQQVTATNPAQVAINSTNPSATTSTAQTAPTTGVAITPATCTNASSPATVPPST